MNYFFSWLQKPYPLPESRGSQFKMAVLLSLVVSLFLFVFRPFNQHENTTQALSTALIGGATVLVTIYFHFLVLFPLFPRFFREERWTIARELIWTMIVIISIAISNMAVIAIWGGFPVTWKNLWLVIIDTAIIGIAPATVSILINQARLLRRYRRQALALNQVMHRPGVDVEQQPNVGEPIAKPTEQVGTSSAPASLNQVVEPIDGAAASDPKEQAQAVVDHLTGESHHISQQKIEQEIASNAPIVLSAEIGKEQVAVAPADLLAITSADNYCKVYLREDGRVKAVILRSPLKRLEGMLVAHVRFWRCHRTAIVNLEAIRGVGGTAQGYRLEIVGMEETIPVSRSLNAQLREKLGAGAKAAV
ncbi:LytR/AlgR family response regulator transcription factor [Paraflavitalea pollutisoli]|uniref:LytR/AlgR family response regulator transcription factor n=1 Tax=Paraflavitalea pollutisoli TaxID=3034143 RepID=UPI0023EDFBAB|nr:LytTR family DNA-binding domain-containing protein [Paraflavitalea sp. H1-2-19X]